MFLTSRLLAAAPVPSGTGVFCQKKTIRYAYGSGELTAMYQKKKIPPNVTINLVRQPNLSTIGGIQMSSDVNSLAHTKWNCKYHIVFAPKYRRQVIYGKLKQDTGKILRQLCERKNVEIIEAEACKDHIHMLVSIPPKLSVSGFIGYLKGKK
ncbi:hypothetical protein HMSSN036_12760 [Paenibacillus macerans]|nr:hypothetical protein HMSSN036_12760 [Paenibacillus macerans]